MQNFITTQPKCGRGFATDRRDCSFALGENSPGSNRNRGTFLRRRIRRYQDRCWTPEHSARFPRNLAGGSGRSLAEIEVPETGGSRFHQCKRRSGESAQLAASASEAHGQKAWSASDRGFSELPHHCGTQKYRQPPNAVQKTRFLPREFLFLAAALFLIPIP